MNAEQIERSSNLEMNRREKLLLLETGPDLSAGLDRENIINIDSPKHTVIFKSIWNGWSVVIKAGEDYVSHDFNEVTHEAFIGFFGVNRLDSKNFAQVLDANINTVCPKVLEAEKLCSYVVYEYISGPTLKKYLKGANSNTVATILMTLFDVLYHAWIAIDFTHYDLHLDNIIIHQDQPVLIDYGASHIKYKGQDYGRILELGGIKNESMWVHDVFKVLISLLAYINRDILQHRLTDIYQDKINWLEYEIYEAEAARYSPEYIQDIEEDIADWPLEEQTIELEKLHSHNSTLEQLLTGYRSGIERYTSKLAKVTAGILPPYSFALGPIIKHLLRFFTDRTIDLQFYQEYQKKFAQPSSDILARNLQFADFLTYARTILG